MAGYECDTIRKGRAAEMGCISGKISPSQGKMWVISLCPTPGHDGISVILFIQNKMVTAN